MYDYAQTFFIDKAKVKGAPRVNLSRVDLYFKSKPKRGSLTEKNKSGIFDPGVEVAIVEVHQDGTPNLKTVSEFARLEWSQIVASGDASQRSTFVMPNEVYIKTDKMYALYIRFDGMEDYQLWTDRKGYPYINTVTISPGCTDKLVGNLYITRDRLTADFDPSAAGGTGANQGVDQKAVWTPQNDQDLKFEVFVSRYRTTAPGATTPAVETFNIPHGIYEYIVYDAKHSIKAVKPHDGEKVFQVAPLASNNGNVHTVSVSKGKSFISSPTANFEAIYTSNTLGKYIVLVSNNHETSHPSGDRAIYNVCKVMSVDGNTMIIDRAPSFTNSVANFMVTPVAFLDFADVSKAFNSKGTTTSWYWEDRNRQDLMILKNSSANLSHRFVNNSIQSITITANGGGYSNSDYVEISSGSSGAVNAYANVRTNESGNLTAVYLTNAGAGMVAAPNIVIRSNPTTLSSGSGATFDLVEGPFLKSELKKYTVKDIEVINVDVDAITPYVYVNNPSGTLYNLKYQMAYYKNESTGAAVVNQNATTSQNNLKNFELNDLLFSNTPLLVSRSNEVKLLSTQSGNSTAIIVSATTNNDFVSVSPSASFVYYHKYIINNDYTDEHTSFGKAAAKHITKKVTFESGRLAEDVTVYLRAFRPPGTDFKVYARIYNSQDPEAFDDKDWSLLECTSGADQVSSPVNKNDIREFTYGLPLTPTLAYTLAGTVNMATNDVTITGTGTNFIDNFAGVKANDLVMIYDPLFVDSKYFISSVNVVSSDTSLTLDDFTSNTNLTGTTLKMAKIKLKNQAFRNINNDNVARYYNTSMHVYDGYDTFAIKVVMLSTSTAVVPEVVDIRSVGVSA